ncbi:MAG: tetratricopeptide repeat protein, partial [Planctomycetes bacterium]|nr:tetratricopeptide repeat protein [Planctomycetota bacterium]
GLSVPAQTWSMQALKARPECLWAAAIALESKPDATQLKEILKPLQSGNDVMSRTVQARQAMNEKQFDKAIEIWRQAAAAEKDNPEVLLNLGLALEQAGRLADALPIYRRVWEATQNPIAANNAAYLTSQLHPKDTAKLAEAQKWMEAATKVAPDTAAFRDTLGWLACLQGRHDEALLQLGRAIKGLPDSPEAHYHLACAQAAAGRTDLARWHYAAAVALAEKLKAAGGESAVSAQEAGRLAKEALARLDPKKS